MKKYEAPELALLLKTATRDFLDGSSDLVYDDPFNDGYGGTFGTNA